MGTIVQLKRVRISYVSDLFVAAQYKGKGAFRHTCTFIVEPGSENDAAIQNAINIQAQEAWGKKSEGVLADLRNDKKNFAYQKNRKNTEGEIPEGFQDKYALSAVRKAEDGVPLFLHNIKDPVTGKPKRLTGSEGVIYGGCYVNAKVEIWAQSGEYVGIRCGLLAVQYDAPGESFGGASRPSDEGFDTIEVEEDDLV